VPVAKELIYNDLENGLIIINNDEIVVDFNNTAKIIIGENLVVGAEITNIPSSIKIPFRDILDTKIALRFFHHNKLDKWYNIKASIFNDDQGSELGKIIYFNEVTDIKKKQDMIEDSRHFLASIIDFSPDPTFVVDEDGRVIIWNKAIEKLTKVKPADILGKENFAYALPFYKERRPMLVNLLLDPSIDPKKEGLYEETEKEDGQITAEFYTTNLDKKGISFWATAKLLYDDEDKDRVVGAIEIIRDITDKKTIERKLKTQLNDLETLNRTMTNRELRMVELKEEIEKLKKEKQKLKSEK
jgi:PAS domain S-box-containing protein